MQGMAGQSLTHLFVVQVNRIVKAQGGLMAEDRRALVSEQQASMERLASLISASINRDLPLRMEEIVRAEVTLQWHPRLKWVPILEGADCH